MTDLGGITVLAGDGTIQNGGNTDVFSGVISGPGGLSFAGSGRAILTGTDTYGGSTIVAEGTLQVDGSIAASATTVKTGATLGGNGTVGDVTVRSGGTLAPGASAGILHTGDVALSKGAHFAFELGGATAGVGGYDQLAVAGAVHLNGAALDLSLTGGFQAAPGETFVIIDNDGADAVAGTFAGLAEGSKFYAGGATFTISYHGGDGNDIVATMVKLGVTIIIGRPGNHHVDATHCREQMSCPG